MKEQGTTDASALSLTSFVLEDHRIDVAVPAIVRPESPVLVMHDGANLMLPLSETWNGQNWQVIESLEAGRVATELLPVVIGVHTGAGTSRYNQLSPASIVDVAPTVFDTIPAEVRPADRTITSVEYQAFLAQRVLPFVAAELGITLDRSRTAIGGSSMGGLASIYGLGQHPEVYGAALAFSTHWPFGGDLAVETLIDALPAVGAGHRLWLDSGNRELDEAYPRFHYAAIDRLEQRAWLRDRDFEARIYAGTGHQEHYWAARWPDAVNWWLGATPRG